MEIASYYSKTSGGSVFRVVGFFKHTFGRGQVQGVIPRKVELCVLLTDLRNVFNSHVGLGQDNMEFLL